MKSFRTPNSKEVLITSTSRQSGLCFAETSCVTDTRMSPHNHQEAHLIVVLDGEVELDCRRQRRRTMPGTLTFLPPGEVHANCFYTGARTFQIIVQPTWLERLGAAAARIEPVDHQQTPLNWLAARLYREFQHADSLSPLVLEGQMLELMAMLSREAGAVSENPSPRWLRQARDLLHAHFRHNLSLSAIAAEIGVHPAHLTRAFRKQYHTTIGDYVRGLRIEAACHLLTTSDIPLAQLALELGFADQGHFSRTFKSRTSMSPAEFRKISRHASLR